MFKSPHFCIYSILGFLLFSWPVLAQENKNPGQSSSPESGLYEQAKKHTANREFSEAKTLYEKALKLSSDEKFISRCLNNLGVIAMRQDHYLESISYYERALAYYERAGNDTLAADCHVNIGQSYKALTQYQKSLEHFFEAARLMDKLGCKPKELARAYYGIGNLYRRTGEFEASLQYHQKALALQRELNDSLEISASLNNIGKTYMEMEFFNEAYAFYNHALNAMDTLSDSLRRSLTYYNLAEADLKRGNPNRALQFLNEAKRIQLKDSALSDYAYTTSLMGLVLGHLRQFEDAILLFKQADSLGRQINDEELLMANYTYQIEVLALKGDYKQALEISKKLSVYKDQVTGQQLDHQWAEMRALYEVEEKEHENELLTRSNALQTSRLKVWRLRTMGGVALALLLFIILLLTYKQYRLKKKYGARIETLLQELHHRVNNNLQTLSGLLIVQLSEVEDIKAKEALKEAQTRVTAMTLIHRSLYGTSKIDHLHLRFDLFLEQLAKNLAVVFGKAETVNFGFELSAESIGVSKAIPLGLIANELICNALKHGKEQDGILEINVRFARSPKHPGYDMSISNVAKQMETSHKPLGSGMGLINVLCKQIGAQLHVETDPFWTFKLQIAT